MPVSILNNDVSNSIEDEEEEDAPMVDDDFTTHGLERLSSAATCLVAGVEYTHGQQVRNNTLYGGIFSKFRLRVVCEKI